MDRRQFIHRTPPLIQRERLIPRPSQRPIFLRRFNSGPTHFERRVEPYTDATVLIDKLTVCFLNPCATAERNDSCLAFLQHVTQCVGLDCAKRGFTVLVDQLRG